jgi:hypothetical protein
MISDVSSAGWRARGVQGLRRMRKPGSVAAVWTVNRIPAAVLATHLLALVAWVGIWIGR